MRIAERPKAELTHCTLDEAGGRVVVPSKSLQEYLNPTPVLPDSPFIKQEIPTAGKLVYKKGTRKGKAGK